jgi:hypothetical protein
MMLAGENMRLVWASRLLLLTLCVSALQGQSGPPRLIAPGVWFLGLASSE